MNIWLFSIFQYSLETFTESRSTAWVYEPYNGKQKYTLQFLKYSI